MTAAKKKADPEVELRELIASTHDDPEAFVRLVFPWGEPGGPLEDAQGPDDWQLGLLRDIGRHFQEASQTDEEVGAFREAIASGHGVGKSAIVSWIVLWFISTRPHCAGVVTANTKPQLDTKTWREVALWHGRALNSHWFKWTATKLYAVEAPATWYIAAIPWSANNPEAFAGLHADDVLVIYDEASAIDDSIWEVSEGAMTTQGAMWCVFGNPTRNVGKFRECFGRQSHRWHTRQVDARESRLVNTAEVERWVEDYGEDSDFIRVRVKGQFPRRSSAQLISEEVVSDARRRHIGSAVYGRYPVIIGADIARFGDDRTVITTRQGPVAWKQRVHREADTMEVVGYIIEEYRERDGDVICVDGVGLGAGVVDRLKQLGYPVVDVQSAARAEDPRQYANSRAELWARCAGWLEEASLPDDDQLADELCGVEYGYNIKVQMLMESKEDVREKLGYSPDKSDSLVLTFADPNAVARTMSQTGRPGAKPVKKVPATGWT